MGGRPVLVAGFVAVALAVGGCSSGAQGAPEPDVGPPPPATSSTPSVSPSSTGQATLDPAARARIPKAARAHTPQGAEAFARFYLEQVNKAWMAPDPELIRPYALESCKTCANYVSTAESLKSEGLRYEGSPSALGPSIVMPSSSTQTVLVHIGQIQLERRIIRKDGTTDELMQRVPGETEVQLSWLEERWVVIEVKDVQ
jgi:Family of unknown function (DUF6318)